MSDRRRGTVDFGAFGAAVEDDSRGEGADYHR
jgi:hypothetical protein